MTFKPDFFKANRRRLFEAAGADLIVMTANGWLQSSAGLTFPFKQDSSFWYLTGIDEPDISLVISDREEFLIVPSRGQLRQVFDGSLDSRQLSQTSAISQTMTENDGWRLLSQRLKASRKVAVCQPAPSYSRQTGFYTNPSRRRLLQRLKRLKPNLQTVDLRSSLAKQRSLKQPVELAAIRSAIDITAKAFEASLKKLNQYHFEYQLQAALEFSFTEQGAAPAFPTIVASGPNAVTLHYVANQAQLESAELVLIDAGALSQHYNADISRTVALGRPTNRQRAVYAAVQTVQEFAIAQLKPGMPFRDYAKAVEKFMGRQLLALKLIKSNSPAESRRYFPHGVSHYLGVDVHDPGDYSAKLQPGMVLTVEPGIYIPEEGIGIRLEDDILITDKGTESLSAGIPKQL